MKTNRVLGIMSGTSVDGIDYALCEVKQGSIKLLDHWSRPFSSALRKEILRAALGELDSYELATLHHDLGRLYASAAPKIKCDYAGLHGQTVFHQPLGKHRATLQIGEPSYLAVRLKCPVISNFRTMDMALGGHAAPLAPIFHKYAFSRCTGATAVQNIGGIANVSYLPASKSKPVLAFDTGPGNMLMDRFVMHMTRGKKNFDEGGKIAATGFVDFELLERWLKHPYFKARPPKTTGRELFGEKFFKRLETEMKRKRLKPADALATLTAFTSYSIAESYAAFLPTMPSRVVVCGGGANNLTLLRQLKFALNEASWIKNSTKAQPIELLTSADLGWPPHCIEPAAFALLAYLHVSRKPGNIMSVTGARREQVLGQMTPWV